MEGYSLDKKVWRVRWWVRVLSVAVLGLPVAGSSHRLGSTPAWDKGLPADQWPPLTGISVVLLVVMWAAFHARAELADGQVRVVNPWGTRTFSLKDLVDTWPGPLGLEFELRSGRKVAAFAIQCMPTLLAEEPRWAGVARTVEAARDAGRLLRPRLRVRRCAVVGGSEVARTWLLALLQVRFMEDLRVAALICRTV